MADKQTGQLKNGSEIRMKNGNTVKILSFIGDGGQGEVYCVESKGKKLALKWYKKDFLESMHDLAGFYQNLVNNIESGAPTNSFLWPLGITEKTKSGFGYIMEIRPERFYDLNRFFQKSGNNPQVHFRSVSSVVNASINIIESFRVLHNNGFSYQDINDGNFFIDPKTGDVLICDNDNISPFGTNFGILGKQRWMAPEIITRQNDPDKKSDLFSLSVVLFRLLFLNHPLEGRYSTPPCLTPQYEKKYYGEAPIFIYDPTNDINRPIPGTDHNLRLFWPFYPQYIRDIFIQAFSQDVMMGKAPRILEIKWLDTFFRMKAEIGSCPYCGGEMLFGETGETICPNCRKRIAAPSYRIKLSNCELPLFCGMKLYFRNINPITNDYETIIGEVISNPQDPKQLGFRNLTQDIWKASSPAGITKEIKPGAVVPFADNITVEFAGKHGKIIQ